MIKKIVTDGKPNDEATKLEVNKIIEESENDNEMYVIGIDYSTEFSKDFTAVTRFTENEDGTITVKDTKIIGGNI